MFFPFPSKFSLSPKLYERKACSLSGSFSPSFFRTKKRKRHFFKKEQNQILCNSVHWVGLLPDRRKHDGKCAQFNHGKLVWLESLRSGQGGGNRADFWVRRTPLFIKTWLKNQLCAAGKVNALCILFNFFCKEKNPKRRSRAGKRKRVRALAR